MLPDLHYTRTASRVPDRVKTTLHERVTVAIALATRAAGHPRPDKPVLVPYRGKLIHP